MVRERGLFTGFLWRLMCTLKGLECMHVSMWIPFCVCICDVWFFVHGLLWVAYGVSLRGVQPSLMKTDDREMKPLPVSTAMHTCVMSVCTIHVLHPVLRCSNLQNSSYRSLCVVSAVFVVLQGHERTSHWMKTSNRSFIQHVPRLTQRCSPQCSYPKVSVSSCATGSSSHWWVRPQLTA